MSQPHKPLEEPTTILVLHIRHWM